MDSDAKTLHRSEGSYDSEEPVGKVASYQVNVAHLVTGMIYRNM